MALETCKQKETRVIEFSLNYTDNKGKIDKHYDGMKILCDMINTSFGRDIAKISVEQENGEDTAYLIKVEVVE